jgi:hypothetical protein
MKMTSLFKSAFGAAAGLLMFASPSWSQTASSSPAVEELKKQVQQLREENQKLRALLGQQPVSSTTPSSQPLQQPRPSASSSPTSDQQGLTHWLTSSSNKRHNSSCRWYRNSHGRPCRPDEGIPCKICGG